jgi:hypothetical protein
MNAPILAPLPVSAIPARIAGPGVTAWEVVRSGSIGEVELAVGDRVVCEPTAQDGVVVLVPRGRGRPVLGRQIGGRLSGAWGEPCHPGRWEIMGAPRWRLVLAHGRWQSLGMQDEQLPLFASAA